MNLGGSHLSFQQKRGNIFFAIYLQKLFSEGGDIRNLPLKAELVHFEPLMFLQLSIQCPGNTKKLADRFDGLSYSL